MKKTIITMAVTGMIACMMFAGCGTYDSTSTETHIVKNADGTTTTTTRTTENGETTETTETTSASTVTEAEDASASKLSYDLTIVNDTDFDFHEIYMSDNTDDWGADVAESLDGSVLEHGYNITRTFTCDTDDTDWNLKVVREDGQVITFKGIDMSGDGRAQVLTLSGANDEYTSTITYAE